MHVRRLIIAALSPFAVATTGAKFFFNHSQAPCYIAVTAFIADSTPFQVRRIISTGVRRFVDAHASGQASCAPANRLRADSLRLAVMAQLGATAQPARWVAIENTDSNVVADHLVRLARFAPPGLERIIVHVGSDSDLVSLPFRGDSHP